MECDAMSNDVTFEELEKTAFEFAKASGAGTVVSLSRNAMEMAEQWHDETGLRKSLYNAKRASWQQVNGGYGNSTDDFVENQTYWIIQQAENKVMQAKFSKFSDVGNGIQPMFYEDGNTYLTFPISHYIKKEEGDKILLETPPPLPTGVKRKSVEHSRPIPSIKNYW